MPQDHNTFDREIKRNVLFFTLQCFTIAIPTEVLVILNFNSEVLDSGDSSCSNEAPSLPVCSTLRIFCPHPRSTEISLDT